MTFLLIHRISGYFYGTPPDVTANLKLISRFCEKYPDYKGAPLTSSFFLAPLTLLHRQTSSSSPSREALRRK